jgi:hypothetical protein
MHYGREKAHNAINEQIKVHGKSELEAIKHVGYNNSDPQVQHYFTELANHKRVASAVYAKKALLSPTLVAGGTAGLIYGRKRGQNPREAVTSRLERLIDDLPVIEFETTKRTLRNGVRLDKYEKTISQREIDRHIHDYLRSGILGAAAGVAIPGSMRLRNRALIGAGAGAAVQGALHASGAVDDYGEQSEESKVMQRNIPKWLGAAAVVGGLVSRYRNRRNALIKVFKPSAATP